MSSEPTLPIPPTNRPEDMPPSDPWGQPMPPPADPTLVDPQPAAGPPASDPPASGLPVDYPPVDYSPVDYPPSHVPPVSGPPADYPPAPAHTPPGGYPPPVSGPPVSGLPESGYVPADPVYLPPSPPHPSSVPPGPPTPNAFPTDPGQVVAQIGDITVTTTQIRTPGGVMPLAGSSWQVTEHWQVERETPGWAIIAAILGFFVLTVFSLLFLLVKRPMQTGTAQVTVINGPHHHIARVPVADHGALHRLQSQVNYVQSLATGY